MQLRGWTRTCGTVRATALTIAALLVTAAQGQEKPKETLKQIATGLVRQLELESHRSAAAKKLVLMGAKAVPAMIRGLEHPSSKVTAELAMVLRAIGNDARPAIPALQRMAKG